MKTLALQQKERVASWVASRISGCAPWADGYNAIGLEKDGVLVAGVVIDGYVPKARCSIHCAADGKNWLTRAFIVAVFDYVFRQLECRVVVNPVNSSNEKSMRFTASCGFAEACRIKNGYADGDLVIFELRKESCKWLG